MQKRGTLKENYKVMQKIICSLTALFLVLNAPRHFDVDEDGVRLCKITVTGHKDEDKGSASL